MLPDNLRSVVYRSFVICDDPKGVDDCATTKKSKSGSQKMEHKIESQRTPKSLHTSSEYKEERKKVSMGTTHDLHDPSSFQLLEVSRGARKLNHTVDSFSKRHSFDGQSTDLAKDLLRGALDLQKSLVMLSKLQEASQYMANLKKKQEFERGRADEDLIERTNSNRFRNEDYQMGFQKPRHSADGSSRDCFDELKKVIGDSLARQNLLPSRTSEERTYFDRRQFESVSEMPSTSSSRSSMIHSNNSGSVDSSLLWAAPQKKAKSPNLIAKLMGLEELPPKPLQIAPPKQLVTEKNSNPRRPVFEIDMPKGRKPQFVFQKANPERTLKEILETMQFKGLLRSNSVEGCKPQSHNSRTSHSQGLTVDIPPIVIIKPLHCSYQETKELPAPKFIPKGVGLDTKEMLAELKVRRGIQQTPIDCEKVMQRELEREEVPSKRLSQKGGKTTRGVVKKTDKKEVKTMEKASSKVKVSFPVNQKPQKKKAFDRKAEKIQTASPTSRKPIEENVKLKSVSKSSDAKVSSTKPRKPGDKSNIAKKQISRQQSTAPNTVSKHTSRVIVHNRTDRKKNQIKKEKPVKEPPSATLVTEISGCKVDDKRVNLSSENVSLLSERNTILADQVPAEEATVAPEIQIEEHCSNGQSSLCRVELLTTQYEEGSKAAEEIVSKDDMGHNRIILKSSTARINLKHLFLSTTSFLNHAEELFNLDVDRPKFSQTLSINDFGEANVKLSFDYANELMQRKSVQESQSIHPLLQTCLLKASKACISVDHLVEEICDGIENLRGYSKIDGENIAKDSVSDMLQRDLQCMGVVTGVWDLGWRSGFSLEEVDQVVAGIEKIVLGGLMEEVFTDFVL